jgi:aldehyde dehydrogenase (NAD+)
LGGKSANIILDDADFASAVKEGAQACFRNTGQSCNAPTRMLVPKSRMADAAAVAKQTAAATQVGDPFTKGTNIGPLPSKAQFEKVERLINKGIEEGAKLIVGGPGRPEGTTKGYFAKPTIFTEVRNDMTIAREEIFGPVLSIIPYENEDDAVRIANDTTYGLSGFVTSGVLERARRIAKRIRSGNVHINGARPDFAVCFGAYKQSGNGREWCETGLEEFLELKSGLRLRKWCQVNVLQFCLCSSQEATLLATNTERYRCHPDLAWLTCAAINYGQINPGNFEILTNVGPLQYGAKSKSSSFRRPSLPR